VNADVGAGAQKPERPASSEDQGGGSKKTRRKR